MDLKPKQFKKGELVQFNAFPEKTLGIVRGQNDGKVKVKWIKWPSRHRGATEHGWYPTQMIRHLKAAR